MGFSIGDLFNNNSSGVSPFGSLLGGIGGGFGTPSNSTTNSSGTSSQNFNTNGTSQQTLQPGGQDFLDQLTELFKQFTSKPTNLSGYQAQQGGNINQASRMQQQGLDNNLAARGLSTSPIAATASAGVDAQRVAQQNNLAQSIPLLQNQLQSQALNQGTGFLSALPRGTVQNQSGSQTGSTTQNSTTKQNSGGGLGSLLGGLASAVGPIAGLFSDEELKKDIKPLGSGLKLISKLEPIKFKWRENSEPSHGFSAQQMEKVLPHSVVKDAATGFRKMDMMTIIPHLVSAVQELSKERKAA
jgi:hypothetical protein